MNEVSQENGEMCGLPTLPEEAEHSEKKESLTDKMKMPRSRSHSDMWVSYRDNMNAESSREDIHVISDSPTLPEEPKCSQKERNEADNENPQSDNPSGNSCTRHHHLMTTRELQLYWKKEKYEGKPVRLLFQMQSTRIAEDFLSKFVMYQIIIIKTGSFDGKKAFIERRYSDFERLHRNLLKDFKEEMEDVVFPKKLLMGNLTEEVIRKRMMALKEYLEELYAIRCIRKSQKFIEFFIEPELEEGYCSIRGGQYGAAMAIFQQVTYLQEKLVEHCPSLMVPSLCALVVCHRDMNQSQMAYEVGMKAVDLLEKHTTHRYYMPLLDTLVSLAFKIGKDFMPLREKLQVNEMKVRRTFDYEIPTLKELVVQEYVKD
ncbi:sorting nexin-20 isoform 2-T2 [Anomaloglossus baeobatrachus]|uniref:sorting nexin-20 n=1 Tax=Anomaloglossus baeobatrachus TaxID=238106 RepID=UPI003F502D11